MSTLNFHKYTAKGVDNQRESLLKSNLTYIYISSSMIFEITPSLSLYLYRFFTEHTVTSKTCGTYK